MAMLTRESFAQRFGRKPVFGMVHLRALPGAPLFGGSIDAVIAAAVSDARALQGGRCDGMLFENFGDCPFRKTHVDPETVAAMTRVISDVTREVQLPFGINVLRNDPVSALGIAAATGAAFIRVNVHTGAMVTDQGIIEGDAAETLRQRERLGSNIAIFADHLVKHAAPLAPVDDVQSAKDLRIRGLADALIISGAATGAPSDPGRLTRIRQAVDAPVLVGSGLTADKATSFADADGAIVGTAFKREGRVEAAVEPERVERLIRAFRSTVVR